MKRYVLHVFPIIPSLILLFLCFFTTQGVFAQGVPELMYFTFDSPGNQQNYASAPVGTNPAPLTGLTAGGTGQFGTALVGDDTAPAGSGLNTVWSTNLPATGWTISLWFNNLPAGSALAQ